MPLVLPEPDRAVVRQREAIVADLGRLVPPGTIIADEEGRRAYETDALTAYRRLPLAVALPASTEEVSRLLRYCHANDIKVVARGAGTSLSGGALPAEDALVLGVSRMNRVLDIDLLNRTARVEVGITNLGISEAVKARGFFYAPDPSSQLACTLAGNLGMNSGGAHCLKYGVTTNNVLGLKLVLMDGEVVEIGGAHLDAPGYDLMGLAVGSEGQLAIVTEATVRILRSPEGARPMLLGFDSSGAASRCVSAIIASGIIPVAIEYMDKPAIQVCEAFAKAGYPTEVEALLIVEVEGSNEEIADLLEQLRRLQDLQITIEVRFITLSDRFFERIGVDFQMNIEDRTIGTADLIPGRPWVHLPITMGYDRYPELLIDEKTRLLEDLGPHPTGSPENETVRGRIIAVFGCIGEHDRERRPGMAQAAADIADYTFVTDDNPYS